MKKVQDTDSLEGRYHIQPRSSVNQQVRDLAQSHHKQDFIDGIIPMARVQRLV